MTERAALRALCVDDSEDDFDLLQHELRRGEWLVHATRVDTPDAMIAALEAGVWDIVLVDWILPRFSAPDALRVLAESAQAHVPCIVVSGVPGEETAVLAIKLGARDFIRKDRLDALLSTVERELLFCGGER